jgi:predicted CXXCH cytochrome family protein
VPVVACLLLIVAGVIVACVAAWRGWPRVAILGLVVAAAAGTGWIVRPSDLPVDAKLVAAAPAHPVTSADCAGCHRPQYDSWYRTYHRAMTRDAAPDTVKGDFADAVHHYQGLRTRMTREGDAFFMETVDPNWAAARARAGGRTDGLPPPRFVKLSVDRVVGSHWLQECLHRTPSGAFIRLPVLYHLGERRWVHTNGAFLAPETPDFWAQCRGRVWNETCLYCHNTEPSKNPVRGPNGAVERFDTTVTELGIACAACHGPGVEHVRRQQNQAAGAGADDVVHPAHLGVARRDDICARCHGAIVPRPAAWDPITHRDPFVPGLDLTRFNQFFWSEAQQAGRPAAAPGPTDGRFWGDGTPLTTALEFNGMALSACYQKGAGRMSCLSCHTMHGDDPNYLLKPGMATNAACYQCHPDYRERLAEHTHHAVDSSGSLCANCHMPKTVYSLMATHRSHRIEVPGVAGSVGTGKPNACTLCHLDKSLGWARDRLADWPNHGGKSVPLSADEEGVSAAVLALARGDARTRVVVAGAFVDPAARTAGGTDWFGSLLPRLLVDERYPAVRYLAHKGLRAAHGEAAGPFDFLASPDERRAQLKALGERFDAAPVRRKLPYLPLRPSGLPDDAALKRLRAGRTDPDLSIHE